MLTLRKMNGALRTTCLGISAALTMVMSLTSCEPEFDVNAPYERIPVVVGILDQSDSVHIIKINRTFLGSGNAELYAMIPDSNYFDYVSARVSEVINGTQGRSWPLLDTMIQNKESGVFFYPEQKVYYFVAPDLVEGAEYVLTADLDEGAQSITADTRTVFGADFNFVTKFGLVSMANANSSEPGGTYPVTNFTFKESENGTYYDFDMVFRYSEELVNGDTVHHSLVMDLTELRVNIIDPGKEHTSEVEGSSFYQFLANSIPVDANVVRRRYEGIDVELTVAHEDLDLFIQLSEPSTSIVQTKPEFTNVEGGRGIFSSKSTISVDDKVMTPFSIKELCVGQYTAQLGFCSHLPDHSGENWHCP